MEKHLCAPSYLLFEEGKYFKSCHASSILVLKDGTAKSGEYISLNVPYSGEARVTIYLGGEFVWQDRYN